VGNIVARLTGRGPSEHGPSRVHFLRPGKTGGTALTETLLQHRDALPYEIVFHGHETRLEDVPRGECAMFILRDPLSRFVSAFNGRLREDRPRYDYPWTEGERRAFERFKTPEELASALGSSGEAEQAMRDIGHVNTPYSYWFGSERKFRRRLRDIFFIGFQDRLDDDFELLKQKLGLPAEARLPRDEKLAHRTPESYPRELSETARANLERWYADDIAFVQVCRELAPLVYQADQPPSATKFAPVT
jgi:Sulfotransferase family